MPGHGHGGISRVFLTECKEGEGLVGFRPIGGDGLERDPVTVVQRLCPLRDGGGHCVSFLGTRPDLRTLKDREGFGTA